MKFDIFGAFILLLLLINIYVEIVEKSIDINENIEEKIMYYNCFQ